MGQSLLVGGAAANRRKGESGNTDDPLPDREPGRRGRPWRCVVCGNPGAPPGRHCHAETTHDTCSRRGATWRSGDAADCKSAHPGSIPGVASSQSPKILEKCHARSAEHVTNAERAGTKTGTRSRCLFLLCSCGCNSSIATLGQCLFEVIHIEEGIVLLGDLHAGVAKPL
jgi:hypothetical protein